MKRFLITFTAVLMAVVLCCSMGFAAQENPSHYVEEMDADVELPSGGNYYFLYPDMPKDSPALAALQMTPEDINEILKPNGILLDVMHYDLSHEVIVQVMEDDMAAEVFNYRELSEFERETVAGAVRSAYEELVLEVVSVEWNEAANAVWMVMEYEIDGGLWCYQYSTVYNGKTMTMTASMYVTDSSLESMKADIRMLTKRMATCTTFRHTDSTPAGAGGITGDLAGDIGFGDMDLSDMDLEALADALGLSVDEMMALAQGEMEISDLDLGEIDLEGLVYALGMTEADLFKLIQQESGLDDLDLSVLDLGEIDLEALVDALGLTEEEVFGLIEGELEPNSLDLSKLDIPALVDALGLTTEEVVTLLLSVAGFGGLDWKGLLGSIGRGALTGLGVGVAVVIVIIILLAVIGRKKRGKANREPVAVERVPEE